MGKSNLKRDNLKIESSYLSVRVFMDFILFKRDSIIAHVSSMFSFNPKRL
jgi:hypothetical protein